MPRLAPLAALLLCVLARPAWSQVDPERRRLVQMGLEKPLQGPAPFGGYLFYYVNEPHFIHDNWTLRYALAPVYLDTELGIKEFLPRTDAGLGVSGGGFAESYTEIRQGHYFKEESFNGHGMQLSGSLYPRLSPESWPVPLNMVLRGAFHSAWYVPRRDTADGFVLPEDHTEFRSREGLSLGGIPPEVRPHRAGEISVWHQSYYRDRHGGYGFGSDRTLESVTHLGWVRLLLSYRMESGRQFQVASEAGISSKPDRLDSYRIGGLLPFSTEAPLSLPGYYVGELSVRKYALFGGDYFVPLKDYPDFSTHYFISAANVTYLPGLEQNDTWNEGLGLGLFFDSAGGILRVETNYAYGVDAIRSGHRGAHSVNLIVQLDLEALHQRAPRRKVQPRIIKPAGLDWLNQIIRP